MKKFVCRDEVVRDLERQIVNLRENAADASDASGMCFLILGNPGTGKTTLALLLGDMLREAKVLSKGHCVVAHRSDLIGEYIGTTPVKTSKCIEKAMGGMLIIDEFSSLLKDSMFEREAIGELASRGIKENTDLAVALIGFPGDEAELRRINEPWLARMSVIRLEDYTSCELREIFLNKCQSMNLKVHAGLDEKLESIFAKMMEVKKAWGNAHEAVELLTSMKKIWETNPVTESDANGNKSDVLTMAHIPGEMREYL